MSTEYKNGLRHGDRKHWNSGILVYHVIFKNGIEEKVIVLRDQLMEPEKLKSLKKSETLLNKIFKEFIKTFYSKKKGKSLFVEHLKQEKLQMKQGLIFIKHQILNY